MKKILILDANSSQVLSIAKYIKKYSNYYVVGQIEKDTLFNNINCDKIIVDNYDNVSLEDYDFVLPTGAKSTFKVFNKCGIIKYCNGIFFSSKNLICFDKPKMLELARDLNIPIPNTFYNKKEIDSFPIFYKENFESGGGLRGVAYSFKEIPNHDKLLFQEYINTPFTYAVGFLSRNGELLTYFQHKEIMSYPLEGGSAVIAERYNNGKLLNYTARLIKALNYNGWGLVEFKYCNKRKDFVFMEINAKFWASIEFMLLNDPLFLKLLLNIDYNPVPTRKVLFINRLLHCNLLSIVKNWSHFKDSKIIKESSLIHSFIGPRIPKIAKDLVKKALR